MNIPTPPKKRLSDPIKTNPNKRRNRSKKRLTTYIYTFPNGFKGEVSAESLEAAKDKAYMKHGARPGPITISKKPYEPPTNLTQRLMDHKGLKELRNKLTNPKKDRNHG